MSIDTASRIMDALRRERFRLGDEKRLQREIGACLTAADIPHRAEVRLDNESRIDFMADRVGIEVKIKGQRSAIFRQLERYCLLPDMDAIILVTNAAMGLPGVIAGKPAFYVSLGAGWLG